MVPTGLQVMLPCALPSVTASGSSTGTPSPTLTQSGTGSLTETASLTASATLSQTASVSSTSSTTGTLSSSALQSGTGSLTQTPPSTATPTPSQTPTPSMPICRGLPQVVLLAGTSGTTPPLSTAAAGQPAMYTSGTCATGLRVFFPGSRLLYALDLGERTPLGGTLTITTCGHSANNTVLYVGTGCPSWDRPFGCVAGNDNAAACAVNELSSTLTVTATQTRYFVQLGGFNSATVVSGLAWSYAPPSRSRSASRTGSGTATQGASAASPSRSRSRSRSTSASRTRSRTASRTRSRKAK